MDPAGVNFAHVGIRDLDEDNNFKYIYSLIPLPNGDSRWGAVEPLHGIIAAKNCGTIGRSKGLFACVDCESSKPFVCEVLLG